jgi:hypothetical protein
LTSARQEERRGDPGRREEASERERERGRGGWRRGIAFTQRSFPLRLVDERESPSTRLDSNSLVATTGERQTKEKRRCADMFERKDEKTGRKEPGVGRERERERGRERAEAERCEREEAENSLLREGEGERERERERASEQQPAYTRLYLCRYEGGGRETRDSFPARSMIPRPYEREEILSPIPEKLARRVSTLLS